MQGLFIMSLADCLGPVSDLLICLQVTVALKCLLVKAILSVMSRKDEGLKDSPPLTHPPSPSHLALCSLANPLLYFQDVLDTFILQLTQIWSDQLCSCYYGAPVASSL